VSHLQWENHNKSLQLEAQTYQRIQEKIQERVMNNLGTWIDWQYLQNAAKLLAKVYTHAHTHARAHARTHAHTHTDNETVCIKEKRMCFVSPERG